jgi:hypothetical protein
MKLPPHANEQEREARHKRESKSVGEREREKAKTSVKVKKQVTLPRTIYSSSKKMVPLFEVGDLNSP